MVQWGVTVVVQLVGKLWLNDGAIIGNPCIESLTFIQEQQCAIQFQSSLTFSPTSSLSSAIINVHSQKLRSSKMPRYEQGHRQLLRSWGGSVQPLGSLVRSGKEIQGLLLKSWNERGQCNCEVDPKYQYCDWLQKLNSNMSSHDPDSRSGRILIFRHFQALIFVCVTAYNLFFLSCLSKFWTSFCSNS